MAELSDAQKREFHANGFVKLPGVVPRDRVRAALHAINSSLGSNGIDPADPHLGAQSFCPELRTAAPIVDLLNATPLRSIAESTIAPGMVRPVSSAQLALRFPRSGEPRPPRPHIDGMHSPTNGVPPGVIQHFTALVGVYLNDVEETYAGNFTVWPGTHHTYEDYFRTHGPQSLLDGMPPVELPEPEQVQVRAGDAVLAHYQLGHSNAENHSPNVRYAIYFRLSHHDHDRERWDTMTDIWGEWDGMREIVREQARSRSG
jgi:Phytanoyl-CoA dioxygenase (PhyH)